MPAPGDDSWLRNVKLPGVVELIRKTWDILSKLPGGGKLYAAWLGRLVPYTATIRSEVLELGPGSARVLMKDRPQLRNHLSSLHAVALCNLAELTANLALAYSLPPNSRFIVKQLSISYLKKARGPITARAACDVPADNQARSYVIRVELTDASNACVATAEIESQVGPA